MYTHTKKTRDLYGLLLFFFFILRHLTLFFLSRSVSFVVFDSECRPTVDPPPPSDGWEYKDPLGYL
jgi:hypothetical protein